ncbi:hypothetical protein ACUXIZ_001910 [Cytobacillus horneckiae]
MRYKVRLINETRGVQTRGGAVVEEFELKRDIIDNTP